MICELVKDESMMDTVFQAAMQGKADDREGLASKYQQLHTRQTVKD